MLTMLMLSMAIRLSFVIAAWRLAVVLGGRARHDFLRVSLVLGEAEAGITFGRFLRSISGTNKHVREGAGTRNRKQRYEYYHITIVNIVASGARLRRRHISSVRNQTQITHA